MTEDQLSKILDQQLAKFYGQISHDLDEIKALLDTKADAEQLHKVYRLVDGIAKRIEDETTDQTYVNYRHEKWLGQLADQTGAKLHPKLEQ